MAQIIDGLCDFDNVTADMIARHNISLYGAGDYVLQVDECLEYDLVSNNEIHVKDGMYIMQGRRGCVKKGTTDICIIENGAQAVNRNDIIVIEYVKDEATRLESHTTKVIKGVPAEVAVDPELVTGDINAGAVLHQMPLYRVKIEGLNVVAVEQLFEIGSVAAETVNPMEATEEGFAADAYQTKLQFDEQNKNVPFAFGIDGDGNYGYYRADDSFIPFLTGTELLSVLPIDTSNTYTVEEDGCYIITSFQDGSYPIYLNGENLGNTMLENGCVYTASAESKYYVHVYFLKLKVNDVLSTSYKNARIAVIGVK